MLEPNVLESRANNRRSVVLRAVILTPLAALLLSLLAVSVQYLPGSFLAVTVLALGGIPAAIEAYSAIRDLRAEPITTRGSVARLWKKSRFLFFGRVDYMLIERRLFEVSTLAAMELREGDEVEIVHWPHTNVLISLRRLPVETKR